MLSVRTISHVLYLNKLCHFGSSHFHPRRFEEFGRPPIVAGGSEQRRSRVWSRCNTTRCSDNTCITSACIRTAAYNCSVPHKYFVHDHFQYMFFVSSSNHSITSRPAAHEPYGRIKTCSRYHQGQFTETVSFETTDLGHANFVLRRFQAHLQNTPRTRDAQLQDNSVNRVVSLARDGG